MAQELRVIDSPTLKNKHVPDQLGFQNAAEARFPRMVIISYSNRCNALCPHCPFTNFPETRNQQGAAFVKWDVFKRIADETARFPHSIIRITGTGEPFMHKECADYVTYACKQGARVGIISNGSLVTERVARKLLEADLHAIEFSVDAHNDELYQIYRVGLNFEKTKRNIERFVKLRDEMGKKTIIMASMVIQPPLDQVIDEAVAFWKERVDHVMTRKYLTWDKLHPEQHYDPYLDNEHGCPYPFDRTFIDASGNVSLCGYDIIDPLRNTKKTHFGNVLENSIEELWSHQTLMHIRDRMLNQDFDAIPMCRDCNDRAYRSWKFNYFHALDVAEKNKLQKMSDLL